MGDGVALTMMLIPAGEFVMGAPDNEPGSQDNERPQHLVKLPQFFMGRTPVTQAQWRVVASYDRVKTALKPSPSRFKGDGLPMEPVNWQQATEFCQRLSAKTQKNYHLPSEAQWEYACRAETTTAYHFGEQLTREVANYNPTIGQTTLAGKYPANRWGLQDMHGNIAEWCYDNWHSSYEGAPIEGSAWLSRNEYDSHVIRGGSWLSKARDCRSAYREACGPSIVGLSIGFRVCYSARRTL
nr:formylglycine-generating enzyme family protein [Nodosilinea sp. TSF1-S3]